MMTRETAFSPGKWISTISETSISVASAVVFFMLDILDVIMCVFFRFFDEFVEGKSSSCYCIGTGKGENPAGVDGESELSESLNRRKNVFRKMRLLITPKIRSGESPFCVGKTKRRNRWSDCGCEACVNWMNNETDSRLHLLINEPERKKNSPETTVQNVVLIHGFLSSSLFWEETVFPNLSENAKQNYRLFAVDLFGFGKSPKPSDSFYTLTDHVEMLAKSIILPFKLNSFHLVAHSMGCVIALALAAKYSDFVKSITLVAPPYFSSSKEALTRLVRRRVWPPMLFASALMSWYEHLGRCVCFFICRHHRAWESIFKLLTRKRDLHFSMIDLTRHTHHSAWHTMHNVVCGGAKFLDTYLEVLRGGRVKIHVVHGSNDQVVPVECSFNMKMKDADVEIHIIPNADHSSVILGRPEDFTRNLERLWASIDD
ncbi:hypothetical protein ABFS83_11G021100 [Erythranthe nasuta]